MRIAGVIVTVAVVAVLSASATAAPPVIDENAVCIGPGGKKLSDAERDSLLAIEGTQMLQIMDAEGKPQVLIFREIDDVVDLVPPAILKQLKRDSVRHQKVKTLSVGSFRKEWVGKQAPKWKATDLDGREVTEADTKGKVVVVNFWFGACKPCRMEMPELNELVKRYADRDVVFLAPTFDSRNSVMTFLEKEGAFDYRILPGASAMVDAYGIRAFPTNFVIDREGVIVDGMSGGTQGIGEVLAKMIEKALEQ